MNGVKASLVAVALVGLLLAGCAEWGLTPGTKRPQTADASVPATPSQPGPDALPWWNDRVFYEVFVRSFHDSDGDGIGDLGGLIDKLDYLNDGDPSTQTDLGVTGIWLMPVAETPSYHGYDVVDYGQVARDYGSNDDFVRLVDAAHERGIAVIVDLVMNHTSSQHPWFLDAQTPGSEYDEWYVWQDEDPGYNSPWGSEVWHKAGDRYYYALFWEAMPDLNLSNDAVTAEMCDIARFWLDDMGVDGFRLDGVKHLIEDGRIQEHTLATHAWLQDFHPHVRAISPGALLVGEAWSHTSDIAGYVGNEVDLVFEFDLAEAILESVRRKDNRTLVEAQRNVLDAYPQDQYAAFLTNHDQDRAIDQLRGDPAAAKVAATLLLTNPGVPFVYYGEEIGMQGQKPDERIRTPMRWDASPTAGFTTVSPWQPLAADHEKANVAVEAADPDSLLHHYQTLIRIRADHPALRAGEMALVGSGSRQVYSFLRYTPDEILLVLANLSDESVDDYGLTLAIGPLTGPVRATLLLGEGHVVAPEVNAAGGFEGYAPLGPLGPRSSTIIRLAP